MRREAVPDARAAESSTRGGDVGARDRATGERRSRATRRVRSHRASRARGRGVDRNNELRDRRGGVIGDAIDVVVVVGGRTPARVGPRAGFDDFVRSGATYSVPAPKNLKDKTTRKPSWLKRGAGESGTRRLNRNFASSSSRQVCEEAKCPNLGECWGGGRGANGDGDDHDHGRLHAGGAGFAR